MKKDFFVYLDGSDVCFVGHGPNGEFGKEYMKSRGSGEEKEFKKVNRFSEAPIIAMKDYKKDFPCDGGGIVYLSKDGKVYVSGREREDNTSGDSLSPMSGEIGCIKPIRFPSEQVRIRDIACGSSHMLFVSYDGLLYGRGSNIHMQLGQTGWRYIKEPKRICKQFDSIKIRSVEAFYDVSFAISDKGILYSWGSGYANMRGRILNDTQATKELGIPTNVFFGDLTRPKVIQVVAGVYTIYALVEDMENNKTHVYFWGSTIQVPSVRPERRSSESKILFQREPKRIPLLDEKRIMWLSPFKYLTAACYALSSCGTVYKWIISLDYKQEISIVPGLEGEIVVYMSASDNCNHCITRDGMLLSISIGTFEAPFISEIKNENKIVSTEEDFDSWWCNKVKVGIPLGISIPIAKKECVAFVSQILVPLIDSLESDPRVVGKKRKFSQFIDESVQQRRKKRSIAYLTFDSWVEIFILAFFYHVSFLKRNEIITIIRVCWRKGKEMYTRIKRKT